MSTSSPQALHIFISHSHLDNDFGTRIVDDLHKALGDGSTVWYDALGGLHGGDTWWLKIASVLKTCNVFIVLLSPNSVSSKWVLDEINMAWLQRNASGMLIIPIMYRRCEIPEYLNIVQIISFLPPKSYGEAFNELLTALGLVTQAISKPAKPIPILSPISGMASSAIRRFSLLSKERIMQVVLLLIIVMGIILSSIWLDQSAIVDNIARASELVTAGAIAAHYPFSDSQVLEDRLTDTNQHDKWGWDRAVDTCQFTRQGYAITASNADYFNACLANNTNFTNFTYEVTMTITAGDCGALLFRANAVQSRARHPQYYLFGLCQFGYYFLSVYGDGLGPSGKSLIDFSPSGFNVGLNYPIPIAVVARGSAISLYIDGTFINRITNSVYTHGQIGAAAYPYGYPDNNPTQVIFSNAKVWTL